MTDLATRYDEAVLAGAAWLDEHHPDWVRFFADDLAEDLHMEDCNRCVLGHVLGSFWAKDSPAFAQGGIIPFNLLDAPAVERSRNWKRINDAAAPLGFCLDETVLAELAVEEWALDDEWEELGRAWQRLIRERLGKSAEDVPEP
jgi:hypothetical protein